MTFSRISKLFSSTGGGLALASILAVAFGSSGCAGAGTNMRAGSFDVGQSASLTSPWPTEVRTDHGPTEVRELLCGHEESTALSAARGYAAGLAAARASAAQQASRFTFSTPPATR